MDNQINFSLDFFVDKLTRSIENTISGDSFPTDVIQLTKNDLKQVTKKNGWNFNWRLEYADPAKDVYKLTVVYNPLIIQGLISISKKEDHLHMDLLENAPFNVGKNKLYQGVAGNLVAFACKLSFQLGFDGNVAFYAKTRLISHYEKSLGAWHIGGHRMLILPQQAKVLVNQYFKS